MLIAVLRIDQPPNYLVVQIVRAQLETFHAGWFGLAVESATNVSIACRCDDA